MALSRDELRSVARLARLELTDEQLEMQGRRLNELLARVEELQGLDVTGIEPTAHSIPRFNVHREDVLHPSLAQSEVLANAPEARDGCFVVPRIIED